MSALHQGGKLQLFDQQTLIEHQLCCWRRRSEWASLEAVDSKGSRHLPAVQETQVPSLGGEDPLEEEMTTHSSILAWRIPWTKEPGGLPSMASQRVGHDCLTGNEQDPPALCPQKSCPSLPPFLNSAC